MVICLEDYKGIENEVSEWGFEKIPAICLVLSDRLSNFILLH